MLVKGGLKRLEEIKAKIADGTYTVLEGVIEARKVNYTFGTDTDAVIDSWNGVPPKVDTETLTWGK